MKGFNLLPWRELHRNKIKKVFFLQLIITALAALMLLICIHLWFTNKQRKFLQFNQKMQTELQEYQTKNRSIDQIKQKQQKTIEQIRSIKNLQIQQMLINNFFEVLAKITPPKIQLDHIQFSKNSLLLNGKAATSTDIYSFIKKIQLEKCLINPTIKEIKTSEDAGNKKFILQMTLQP